MSKSDFNTLCKEREALRIYVREHAASLEAFKDKANPWFRWQEADGDEKAKDREVRHLTTTASCLESLDYVPAYDVDDPPAPCPPHKSEVHEARTTIANDFTSRLLADGDYRSENEDLIYTRVRTLPVLMRLASDEVLRPHYRKLKADLEGVWNELDEGNIRAQGIAERPKSEPDAEADDDIERYPPNAFHTYWAVRLMHEYSRLYSPGPAMEQKKGVAQLWARRTLSTQTALIGAGAKTVDAHQLAWALSTDVLCRSGETDRPTTADHQHLEIYQAALKAFFSQQQDGHWPLYQPLFHYSQAGNAYCYTYETLAELLSLALDKEGGRILRDQLREFSEELLEAWRYARRTALTLKSGGSGWCSGHHPHRTEPEAWATAAVFSYLQNLRCLVGHWTASSARTALSVKPSDSASVAAGEETIGGRGQTWHRDRTLTVGRQISSLFLHPIRASAPDAGEKIDPDCPLVNESRSAVLFGPPGTSKTSMVSGLAKALEWDYVEILASDFLSEGMDAVPKIADEIFQKVMELDRCVILFDEIDELMRLRDDHHSDPFGRFLTTSMLPKLAKLWDQRRVLFFVATNDISAADPAIKRSQRFDAAIFVPPPSFEKKQERLKELGVEIPELTAARVDAALKEPQHPDAELGVFAFLRFDQLDDLAFRIKQSNEHQMNALRTALKEFAREMIRTDWRRADDGDVKDLEESKLLKKLFERWDQHRLDERRDYRNEAVLHLSESLYEKRPKSWKTYRQKPGYVIVDANVSARLKQASDGHLELAPRAWKAIESTGTCTFAEAN